ncbi:MAG: hypothetical protein QXI33_00515 [Candidatus Pacearchaeota archaeon]
MSSLEKRGNKPVYDLDSFSKNIFDEFCLCLSNPDIARRFDGIILYGLDDFYTLNYIREKVSGFLNEQNLDYLVIASPSLPEDFPTLHHKSNNNKYQLVDVGWFVKQGWLKMYR